VSFSEHPIRYIAALVVSWPLAIAIWGGSLFVAIKLGQQDSGDSEGGAMLFIVPVSIAVGGLVAYGVGRFVFNLIATPDEASFDEIDEYATPLQPFAAPPDPGAKKIATPVQPTASNLEDASKRE
jgi:hypothetical protein